MDMSLAKVLVAESNTMGLTGAREQPRPPSLVHRGVGGWGRIPESGLGVASPAVLRSHHVGAAGTPVQQLTRQAGHPGSAWSWGAPNQEGAHC